MMLIIETLLQKEPPNTCSTYSSTFENAFMQHALKRTERQHGQKKWSKKYLFLLFTNNRILQMDSGEKSNVIMLCYVMTAN